jgi:YVTN family beta-propeller protein
MPTDETIQPRAAAHRATQPWFALALALSACTTCLPARAAAPNATERLYATNEADGTLGVIDANTRKVIDTIVLGKRPRGLVTSADGRLLYVALSGSPPAGPGVDESKLPPPDHAADGIGVVDLAQRKVVRTLRGISDPEQLALSVDGRRLYVASEDSGKLVVFATGSGQIETQLAVGGEPEGVAVSADSSWICATSEQAGTIAIIDATSGRLLHTVGVGRRPRNCRFTQDGRRLYVPSEVDATLSVVDVEQGKLLQAIKLPGAGVRPMGLVLSPDGGTAYVTTGHAGTVMAVDLRADRVRASAKVGGRPWGLALSPDGGWLYTADGPSDTVSVVEADSMRTVDTIKVGAKPWGVALAAQHWH